MFLPRRGRVLVLDGGSQSSLSVLSSLGSHGVPLDVGALEPGSLGSHSRYVDEEVVYPDPATEPEAFTDAVETAVEATEYFAVIPTRDDTTTVLSRHKDRLEATGTLVGVEDWSRFRRVADKARTVDLAADLSVPMPETWRPESPDAVAAIADTVTYPVLVKPRSKHVADDQGRLYTHEVSDRDYAHSPADLRSTYERLATADPGMRATPPLVQAVVDGETVTTVGVADDGELVATFQELRLRTTPHSGGSSTLVRGIHDDRMRAYARELVGELGWTGPLQVEFMRTQEDCYLIEINGRYWGSLPLATAAGVDLPWLHLGVLAGERPTVDGGANRRVVQQRLLYGDLKWLAERLADGHPEALWEFLTPLATTDKPFVRPDDPATTVAALREITSVGADALADAIRDRLDR